ncbi:MAG: elongation factor G, partial [Desulfohalobiaceae bacterium]
MAQAKGQDKYLNQLRNIGIIAHIDAGKTTLTERILYYSKKIHRLGEVHEGTATMDYMPEEQERGITITSACTSCNWQDKQINIIDTPGHVDFTIEVERSLRVLDGAVGVFCAVGGVEPQSETVWRQSEHYKVPKLAYVNKLDRMGADFERVLQEMQAKLQSRPLVLQIPDGQGADFKGLIDLLHLEYLSFDQQSKGAEISRRPLQESELEKAGPWREALIEALAEQDEELLEMYVSGQEPEVQHMKQALRSQTLQLQGVPVLAGSALKNVGVQPVLDAVCDYLPSPLEVAQVEGIDPGSGKGKSFAVSSKAHFSALVFKVTLEGGRLLTLMRVYSGQIQAGDTVYNSAREQEHRVARLFSLHAGHKERLDQARAGEIVAAAGLKQARTGDTLCSKADPILLEQISAYQPVISLALEPRNSQEEEKLLEALQKMLQ